MKTQSLTISLAFLVAAFMWGCQESGPVAPESLGPQFTHNDPGKVHGGPKGGGDDDGGGGGAVSLFNSPGVISPPGLLGTDDVGHTCAGGAAKTGGTKYGQVKWHKNSFSDHTHARVELRGVPPGDYLGFGNQEEVCPGGNVDFPLRPFHPSSVTVGPGGDASLRIGLTYPDHTPGPTKLWLTIFELPIGGANKLVLRSPAVEVVIPEHDGHVE